MKYANDLSDLDAHYVFVGARSAVKTSSFFPTIAEIREHAMAEASRFIAQEFVPDRPQLTLEQREASQDESRRLAAKWGPRIREILAHSSGPMAQDLEVVADG